MRYFVFRSHIVNLFRNMNYDEPELKDFLTTKEWRKGLSTLSRIYESKDFLDLTGLVMDQKGIVGKTISDEAMKAIATIIVDGIKAGDLNTRSLNTIQSPRFTRLISELKEAVASAAGPLPASGSTTPPSTKPTGATQASPAPKSKPRTAKPPVVKQKLHWLAVGHLVPPQQYPVAVRLHLEELSTLDIQKFPNTGFLVLRAVLEKSIKAYAESKNLDIKSSGNNSNGYVQLHHALKWFGEYVSQNGPKALIQPVTQLRTGKLVNYTASNDALNAINHNHHFHVDPDEVINCWNSIDSILRELMKP